MDNSTLLLILAWFGSMVLLYLVIRWGVADGMRDFEKDKNKPKK